MALTPQRYVAPQGQLNPGMFPGEDLLTRIQRYMGEAAATVSALDPTEQDQATDQYVYWQAFAALHAALISAPASFDAGSGQGSHSYTDAQIAAVGALAETYHQGWLEVIAPTRPATVRRTRGGAIPTEIVW